MSSSGVSADSLFVQFPLPGGECATAFPSDLEGRSHGVAAGRLAEESSQATASAAKFALAVIIVPPSFPPLGSTNTKSEARNPKQIRNPKVRNPETMRKWKASRRITTPFAPQDSNKKSRDQQDRSLEARDSSSWRAALPPRLVHQTRTPSESRGVSHHRLPLGAQGHRNESPLAGFPQNHNKVAEIGNPHLHPPRSQYR